MVRSFQRSCEGSGLSIEVFKIASENITVEVNPSEDYLMDKTFPELRTIAKDLGINSYQMGKEDVVHAIMELHDENPSPEEEVNLTNFSIYEVRYVGSQGVIRMNAQSTPTHSEYDFYRTQWIEVEEEDYWHFYRKIGRSVDADQIPHWQCRRKNKLGAVKNMFAKAINKLTSKPPSVLKDVKGLNNDRMDILRQMNIGAIPEFLSLPKSVVAEKFFISPQEVDDMFDDARRSFK